ncbi:hypothetical protein HWV62_5680 [Athelia sp. TMB]|nr:hypothetical protein HWV62_5680 [Athelia sp. TMB]
MSSGKKRSRPASPPVRVQASRLGAHPNEPTQATQSTHATQVNTHVRVAIDTGREDRWHRPSVRTAHVTRPAVVDLSGFLVEDGDDEVMVDAELDSSLEDGSNLIFGDDEERLEDPGDDENQDAGEKDKDDTQETIEGNRLSQEWIPHRQTYVDEFLRTEGLGDTDQPTRCTSCPSAEANDAKYKCEDCFGDALLCQSCILEKHKLLPLHRIFCWTGSFFAKTSLYALGHRVYLGHQGQPCKAAYEIVDGFTVFDTTGIHTIKLVFCGCPDRAPSNIQLLRTRWFPATIRSPHSAFTFEVLNTFHLLNIQGKLSLYHFYNAIHSKSDNAGIRKPKNRYDEMRPTVRMWRHTKMLKRAGRGQDRAGVSATRMGECAVECPACPHPGKNLPDSWKNAPEHIKWLYILLVTIDANFRLKLKDKGLKDDPPLGDGWSHMVKTEPFKAYVEKFGHQVEPSTCDSDFRAADHTTSKSSTAFKASGVGGVFCGRHGLVFKNGIGDLQKGERYANMDFIVFSALFGLIICLLLFSYDICCQWAKNLSKRVPQLPRTMQPADPTILAQAKRVIPKMHIHNHGKSCQLSYNLNFIRHSAQSNMEDPERYWAWQNPGSMSTREMTDGARYETLADHAAGWNWAKITTFDSRLLKAIKVAVYMKLKTRIAFENFGKRFPADVMAGWAQMVEAWDKDPEQKNPYEEPEPTVTLASVMFDLAVEEAEETRRGAALLHETSPSRFLQRGLDLEDQQRKLRVLMRGKKTTLSHKTDLLERRATLRHRIDKWIEIQDLYMPEARRLRAAAASATMIDSEEENLYLPSQLPPDLRASPAISSLLDKERRLRIGQADDALHEIRRLLRISSTILEFKRGQHLASQRITTRTRQLVLNFRAKTGAVSDRYIAAYNALKVLDPGGEWETSFKPLNPAVDLHLPRREEDDEGPENTRELSWIWLVPRSEDAQRRTATADEVCESMRVEWSKSMARRDRWDEEVQLLREEMRRVIHYFHWKSQWWRRRTNRRTDASAAVQRGAAAYAARQAHQFETMAKSHAATWYPFLMYKNLPIDWLPEYVPTVYVPYKPRHTDPEVANA